MKFRLNVTQIYEFGKRVDSDGNPHQEDSLYPDFGHASGADRLFVLCDGMGGHDSGEVASATVCRALAESIARQQPDAEGEFTDGMLRQAISDAFDALDAVDTGAFKKMGTTMTLLKFHSRGATVAHLGDSRIYHIRPGRKAADTRIMSVTRDHSLVNMLIAMGELTEEEARTSSQKNVITKAMQPNMEQRPKADVRQIHDIRPGDCFYMCSDGMLEQMDDAQLCYHFSEEAAADDAARCANLRRATIENKDNHTAQIIRVLEVDDPEGLRDRLAAEDAKVQQVPTAAPAPVRPEPRQEPATEPVVPDQPVKTSAAGRGMVYFIVALIVAMMCLGGAYLFGAFQGSSEEENPQTVEEAVETAADDSPVRGTRRNRIRPGDVAPKESKQPAAVKSDGSADKEDAAPATSVPKPIATMPKKDGVTEADAADANPATAPVQSSAAPAQSSAKPLKPSKGNTE